MLDATTVPAPPVPRAGFTARCTRALLSPAAANSTSSSDNRAHGDSSARVQRAVNPARGTGGAGTVVASST